MAVHTQTHQSIDQTWKPRLSTKIAIAVGVLCIVGSIAMATVPALPWPYGLLGVAATCMVNAGMMTLIVAIDRSEHLRATSQIRQFSDLPISLFIAGLALMWIGWIAWSTTV